MTGRFARIGADGLAFVPTRPISRARTTHCSNGRLGDQLTVDLTVRGAGKGEGLGFFAVDDDGGDVDCSKHVHLSEQDAARLQS